MSIILFPVEAQGQADTQLPVGAIQNRYSYGSGRDGSVRWPSCTTTSSRLQYSAHSARWR